MRSQRALAGAFCLCLLSGAIAPSGQAQSPETPAGMSRVSPGKSTRVYVMAAFDAQCRPIAAPRIEVIQAPAKGSVSFREGQTTTVQSSLTGSCIGQRVLGTGVYYTAAENVAGEDTFSIQARLATGEVANRSFQMFISD